MNVQVFKEGKRIKTFPIPFETFVDIDITPYGKIVLLDNLVKKSVYILDSEGKTLNIIPLEGRQIPYGPAVTAIMCVREGKFPGIWGRNRFIVHLLGLWDERNGRVFLGAYLENGEPSNTMIVITPEGKELGRVKLFVQEMPHEIHRSIRVSPEGHIYQMALDKGGVFIRRYEILE